jgi:hypothetical protein
VQVLFGGMRISLWPTINSDESATERSELSWFTGLRVDLPLPATPPSWSAFPLPAFDTFLAIGVRPLGVHRHRE